MNNQLSLLNDEPVQQPYQAVQPETQLFKQIPKTLSWSDILGQFVAIAVLKNALERDRVGTAYLFSGPDGVGKTLTAKCFVEQLGYANPTEHPDVLWVEPTYLHQGQQLTASIAAEHEVKSKSLPLIRIEQVRTITEFLGTSALIATKKVVVIQCAEQMQTAAANALLKTLENPTNGILILISSEPKRLLPTIASRCQHLLFNRLSNEQMLEVLTRLGYSEILEVKSVMGLATGSPGAAIYHYKQLKSIPAELLLELKQPPKDILKVINISRAVETLELHAQLWILQYLQWLWWQQTSDASLIEKLQNAKMQIQMFIQPKLVWDVLLMELIN